MSVFISWSGQRSERAALALKRWLELELAPCPVWMSQADLSPGHRWDRSLHEQLQLSTIGVLCVTPENLQSAWLLYEAGALAMATQSGSVIPYLIDTGPDSLPAPLQQFQSVRADRKGTQQLLVTISTAVRSQPVGEQCFQRFDETWESLAQELGLGVDVEHKDELTILGLQSAQICGDAGRALTARIAVELLNGKSRFVVDLMHATVMHEDALGCLLRGLGVAHRKDADVALAFTPALREALDSAGALAIARGFPSREEALQYFAEGGKHGSGKGETEIVTVAL